MSSPPQMVAGWTFPRVERSYTSMATMKRSAKPKNVGGPGGSGRKFILAIGAASRLIMDNVIRRLWVSDRRRKYRPVPTRIANKIMSNRGIARKPSDDTPGIGD